jgi:hypothetical protein
VIRTGAATVVGTGGSGMLGGGVGGGSYFGASKLGIGFLTFDLA